MIVDTLPCNFGRLPFLSCLTLGDGLSTCDFCRLPFFCMGVVASLSSCQTRCCSDFCKRNLVHSHQEHHVSEDTKSEQKYCISYLVNSIAAPTFKQYKCKLMIQTIHKRKVPLALFTPGQLINGTCPLRCIFWTIFFWDNWIV